MLLTGNTALMYAAVSGDGIYSALHALVWPRLSVHRLFLGLLPQELPISKLPRFRYVFCIMLNNLIHGFLIILHDH